MDPPLFPGAKIQISLEKYRCLRSILPASRKKLALGLIWIFCRRQRNPPTPSSCPLINPLVTAYRKEDKSLPSSLAFPPAPSAGKGKTSVGSSPSHQRVHAQSLQLCLCASVGCSPPTYSCPRGSPGKNAGRGEGGGAGVAMPFPPGELLNPGIEPISPVFPTLQADCLPTEPPGKPPVIREQEK